MKGRKIFVLLFAALMLTSTSFAQQSQRKKVAVVLSGGGAKGTAHIGVLKVLEKAGIPVDIITGTSMGSIVGGLYAVGYDAQTLDSLVRVQDWITILSDKDALEAKRLDNRSKQNTYFLLKTISLGKHPSVSERGGMVKGRNLLALFDNLTSDYKDSVDFNKLPIPFACVATNIVDNTEHDFHGGVLSKAMRASMSIPAVFAPVRLDSMVLVDGGLRNNYPADLARQMGADYIIGVSVQSKPRTADDLKTSADILGQVVDMNCMNKFDENVAMTDVFMRVNVDGYSAASFNKLAIDSLIKRGEDEGMAHWNELMELKKRIGLPDDYVVNRLHLKPDTVNVDSTSMSIVVPRSIHNTLQGGIGVRFDTEEMVALQINGVFMPKNSPLTLETTLRLGKRIMGRLDANLNRTSKNNMRLSYIFKHDDLNVYYEGERYFNMTFNHHAVDFSLLDFNIRNFNVEIGGRFDYYNFNDVLIGLHSDVGITKLNDEHYFSYYANVKYNSENQWNFPSRGARFNARFGYYTDNMADYKGKIGLSIVQSMWRMSFPITERLTFQPMAYGRLMFGDEFPNSLRNVVGGMWFGHYLDNQMPFAGVGHVEYTEKQFVAMQLRLQQRIADNNYVLLKMAGAQHTDKIRNILEDSMMLGGEIGYFYNTMFGPLGATLGYSNKTKEPYFYINLGFDF